MAAAGIIRPTELKGHRCACRPGLLYVVYFGREYCGELVRENTFRVCAAPRVYISRNDLQLP